MVLRAKMPRAISTLKSRGVWYGLAIDLSPIIA